MAKNSIQIKDYSKSVQQQMNKAQVQALENYGKNWKTIVRRIILEKGIYDTGYLYEHTDYKVDSQNKQITTFSDAPYSEYNELGTWKMRARPYMTPSIQEANGALAQILRQEIDGRLSSTQGLTPEVKNL